MIESKTIVNRPVNVTSVYFRYTMGFRSFPRRMEYDGREYSFMESGMSYRIKSGNKIMQIYDMSDGKTDYRLKYDANRSNWVLVSISNN